MKRASKACKLVAGPNGGYRQTMNATLQKIAQEALQLAPAQRAELADFLVESLDSLPPDEIQQLWADEAQRRLAEVRAGNVKTLSGEEVLAEARRLVKR